MKKLSWINPNDWNEVLKEVKSGPIEPLELIPKDKNKWFKPDMSLDEIKSNILYLRNIRRSLKGTHRLEAQKHIEYGEKLIKSRKSK